MRLVRDLIERRVFRYVVAYAAIAWGVLQVIDQLVNNELLPMVAYRGVLALVICGLPGALIVSWFHGAKGRQEIPALERWLLGIVAVFALGTTGFYARSTIDPAAIGPAALAATENPARVAVLYMDSRGGEDADFLASGLSETLIDELSAVSGLHVVSRNGSQLFRHGVASPDSIGRTLAVGSLVGGTVSLSGDRVRVDVTLTGSSTGEQIASRRLERPRSEIFTLQDELADTVAVFLRRAIGRELGERQLRAGTRSTRAWELVQQARQAELGATDLAAAQDMHAAERMLATADSMLARAEQEDPAWLDPVIRRGWVAYAQARLGGLDRSHNEMWTGRGLEHANRAVAAGPENPAALELRATLRYWRFLLNLGGTPAEADVLYHDAEREFRAAIAASGGTHPSAQNALSHLLLNKGELAEAKLNALQAYTVDPFLENAHLTIWRIFQSSWGLQDEVEARRYCNEGIRRFPEFFRFFECRLMLAALPGARPDFTEAWHVLEQYAAASPPQMRELNRRAGMIYIAMALARNGMPDSAKSVVIGARAGPDLDPVRDLVHLESIVWTALGEPDQAVRQLSVYLTANPQALGGFRADAETGNLPWYFQPLLDEPAFRSLVGLR
ncbi:MAG TPA: hypothetical protein VFZ24_05220 [Longimicrobiales bacterium]